jgi:GxxExxY protein
MNKIFIDNFIEPELSYKIQGCLYNVRNKYGRNHKEVVYDRALDEEFDLMDIKYINQPKIDVYSLTTGKKIAIYIPDKLVESKILLELKAKLFLPQEEWKRALEYLKVSKYELLYIVNFGEEIFKPRRFIYTNDRKPFIC